ncbi:MepB family protein [uncultured Elizabethkingia sp.]|nr:MepB family protein [uncultured Elizabethkingia sp.]
MKSQIQDYFKMHTMNEELCKLENTLLKNIDFKISVITQDAECEEYFGYNFRLQQLNIKYRKAKVTPKKNGLFVTLWKRNIKGQTEPFNHNDPFNFYIIAAEHSERFGYFIFPKLLLTEKKILTSHSREGKRGFRIYPAWDISLNKQAEKTQQWQSEYFIDMALPEDLITEKLTAIFRSS